MNCKADSLEILSNDFDDNENSIATYSSFFALVGLFYKFSYKIFDHLMMSNLYSKNKHNYFLG